MNWSDRYSLRSYIRASHWIVPLLALVLQQIIFRSALALDGFLTLVPDWPLGVAGTLTALQAIISIEASFIIFTFGSMLVAIQIAGGQLTPRVIATTLLRDNVIRLTTGLFIFSLLFAIGAVSRIEIEMPRLVVWIASFLGLVSMAAFLFLIDHAARFMRPVSIFWKVADMGIDVIESVFPEPFSEVEAPPTTLPDQHNPARIIRHDGMSAVILAADIEGLLAEARRHDGTIVVAAQIGDFVGVGQPLFLLYGGAEAANDRKLRGCIAFGLERTIEQDTTFAFRVVVDIAVKALSKAINDPTTAVLAMDQLQRLLRWVGERNLRNEYFFAEDGSLRLVFPTPNWGDFVHLTCREIRQYGADSVQVSRRMRAMLVNLIKTLPDQRKPELQLELELLDRAIDKTFDFEEDRQLARVPDSQGLGGGSAN